MAPRISFLRLTHSDESKCELADVSPLTEANVNIYCSRRLGFLYDDFGDPETGLADSLQVLILQTLERLQNVEKLTLCGAFCLQEFFYLLLSEMIKIFCICHS